MDMVLGGIALLIGLAFVAAGMILHRSLDGLACITIITGGALIALVLFGGSKLPELARSLGRSVNEFKKGVDDDVKAEKGPTPPTSS